MRTSTSARSTFLPGVQDTRAPRPSSRPPRPPHRGSLLSPRSSCHAARARGRPRSRSSSFLSLPSDGEHGDDTNAASGGRLDRRSSRRSLAAWTCINFSPKCGSSSVAAAMPVPPILDLDPELPARAPARGSRHPWIRNASTAFVSASRDDVLSGVEHRGAAPSRRRLRSTTRAGSRQRSTSSEMNVANDCSVADAPFVELEEHLADLGEVVADRVFDLTQRVDGAVGVGLDAVPEGLDLQHRAGDRLGQPIVHVHGPAGALTSISDSTVVGNAVTHRLRRVRLFVCGTLTWWLVPSVGAVGSSPYSVETCARLNRTGKRMPSSRRSRRDQGLIGTRAIGVQT